MGTLRQRFSSPLRNAPSRKPVRHVHFEDETRGRSRQRTSCDNYQNVEVEEYGGGRTRYRYRSRSRSRSHSRSRGQRRPTFRRYEDQYTQMETRQGSKGGRNDYYPRNEKSHKCEAERGDDRRHSETPFYNYCTERKTYSDNLQENQRYLKDIEEAQRKRYYYYYPEREHSSYRRANYNTAWTKEETHNHLPNRATYPQYYRSQRSYSRYYSPEDNFYKYNSYSSSPRSSSWPSSTPYAPYSRKEQVRSPGYDYHRHQRECSQSRYGNTRQRSESSRQYYWQRTKAPGGRQARSSWFPSSDRSTYESGNQDGPGRVRIRVQYRRWA